MDRRDANPTRSGGSEWMMIIRARRPDEIDACAAVLAEVHAADRYPLHWPADLSAWLMPGGLLAAWVAEHEDMVIGHVALRSATGVSAASASIWSAATGLPPEQLAVVARLFVGPSARGHSVGAALLDEASAAARGRGLWPVLDVLDHNRSAIALYERKGWRRVASEPVSWAQASGGQPLLHYYIAPDAPTG
ncbi:MAG TPA: GNAT family N-acetyltransferase [Ktedonobacterales bacterium]|nr:GNAT family N-acetyltransferase [Ktedonobacterales bacterium]